MDIRGKVAVIAGASGGIGREVSMAFAKGGTNLVLAGRRKDVLFALKRETEKFGIVVLPFECNLASPRGVSDLAGLIERKFTHVDVLINAAGVGIYKKLSDIAYDDWKSSMEVNATAPFLLTQKLMPLLRKSERSYVISMGSGMGKIGVAGRSPYCASKFALRGLMLSLAKEYKKTNVKIVLLTLGSVLTSFGPLTLEEKKRKAKEGKGYITPSYLAETIVTRIKNDSLDTEVSIYPPKYFSESKRGKT